MYGPSHSTSSGSTTSSLLPAFALQGPARLLGQVLGGWAFAPLFTAQSGVPLPVLISGGTGNACQSFGEMDCTSGGTANHENAVALVPYTGGNSAHYSVVSTGAAGSAGNPSVGGSGINIFSEPERGIFRFPAFDSGRR